MTLPSKSKTVLWFLLNTIAAPALGYAGTALANGQTPTAIAAAVVGALALVLFAVSYLAEFPGEDDVKEVAEETSLSDDDARRVADELAEYIDELSTGDSADGGS